MSFTESYGKELGIPTLPSEDVAMCLQRYKRAKDADWPNLMRCIRNYRAFTGIDKKQWDDKLAYQLILQGRDPKTYNFMQFFIEGVAGNYVMNATEAKFYDREDDFVDVLEAVEKLQKVWYCDKEHGNFTQARSQAIVNGCIYRGVEELIVRRPSANPRTWRVGYESIRPDMVTFDGNLSDNIGRNSKEYWKEIYLDAWEMLRYTAAKEDQVSDSLYRKFKKDALAPFVKLEMECGREYESFSIDSFDQIDRMRLGSRFKCVEWGHIEHERLRYHLHIPTGDPIPETGLRFGSKEDRAAKQDWAIMNGFVLTEETVTEIEDWVPVNYLTVFCEELGLMLTHSKDVRQLNGHIPLYTWSFVQKNGLSIGMPDFGFDAQDTLNKREAQKTKLITQAAVSKPMFHPEAFDNDKEKIRAYIDNANDVSKPVELAASATPGINYFGKTPGTEINQALFQDEKTMVDFLNQIMRLPPAMRGIPGNSAESGIAVGRRVIEGSIMQRMPSEFIQQNDKDKAEDYAIFAPKLYGGRHNYNRKFTNASGNLSLTINEHVGFDEETEEPIIKSDFTKLKRIELTIVKGKENDYLKQAQREMDVAALQVMQPTPQNIPIVTAMQCHLAMNMDFADHAQKEEMEEITKAVMKNLKNQLGIDTALVGARAANTPGFAPPTPGVGQEPQAPQDRSPVPDVVPMGAQGGQ